MNIVITGGTGAIGREVVRQLADQGHSLYLLCRDDGKARELFADAQSKIHPIACDVAQPRDIIKALSDGLPDTIDILINAAAIAPVAKSYITVTPRHRGVEAMWATNVMSYIHTIRLMQPRFTNPSLVINVASDFAGGFDPADPEFDVRPYNNRDVYRATKMANRLTSVMYSRSAYASRTCFVSCHPGGVPSKLTADLNIGADDTPPMGAESIIHIINMFLVGKTLPGGYYFYKKAIKEDFDPDVLLSFSVYIMNNLFLLE